MADYRETPKEIGHANAEMAWDQRHDYDDNEHAYDAYYQNVVDTCSSEKPEHGCAALDAFEEYWAELSGEAFNDAFSALLKCKAPSEEVKVLLQEIQKELDINQNGGRS